jgi:TatD DNase family protein
VIDTHCHLDRVADLAAALDNDLAALITIGTDEARSERAVALAHAEPRVWAAVGIHPTDAGRARDPASRARIEELGHDPRVVAIGETGIDLYWDAAPLVDQLEALAWQIDLARRLGKPVVLHVRDRDGREEASRAAAGAIVAGGYGQGVLHCTNGHPLLLEAGLAAGWSVSFAGNLTYPKATAVHEAARWVPQERLLVETDSPFLSPAPHRGRPNLPAHVRITAAALASHRGVAAAALEPVLDANARRVFGLDAMTGGDERRTAAGTLGESL